MANHKSAAKAHRRSVKESSFNGVIRSKVKTLSKKVVELVANGDQQAIPAFRIAESEIMKAVSKGVFKLNNASRKVSNLAKKVKAFEASQTA